MLNKFLVFILLVISPYIVMAKGLMVHRAWIATPISGVNVTAGYLNLMNQSKKAIAVVSAESDAFKEIQIHKTEKKDGMAKMIRQKSVVVGPSDVVSFQPGGLHLMLFEPTKTLKTGDVVTLNLSTESGKKIRFKAKVKPRRKNQHKNGKHKHH